MNGSILMINVIYVLFKIPLKDIELNLTGHTLML